MIEWLSEWIPHPAVAGGVAFFLVFLLFGRFLSPRLWLRPGHGESVKPKNADDRRVHRPDGTILYVELHGPADGPPLVLVHGCGGDRTEFNQVRQTFADRYRLIIWDLPGMGKSTWSNDRNFSMEKMAGDLAAVLDLAEGRPAVLVGHSTGGMILLTFCRLFPELLGNRVAGLVLAHTCAKNPLYTVVPTWLMPRLRWPVLEPLLRLMIAVSPLTSFLLKLSYLSGLAHWHIHYGMFAGNESREQLDGAAWYVFKAPVSALARTNLAMFRYDATAVLPQIRVPVLIVSGDQDETTIPEASVAMADTIPHAELLVLSPARHLGIIELHDKFAEALAAFLKKVVA